MKTTELNNLANTFAKYAERRDSRIAELARKQDESCLTAAETAELVDRLEKMYQRFMEERAALLM